MGRLKPSQPNPKMKTIWDCTVKIPEILSSRTYHENRAKPETFCNNGYYRKCPQTEYFGINLAFVIKKHTLVYTVVLGLVLTAFFDLSRIAALGIVFYLVMDVAIHWGVLRYLREDVKASAWVPVMAILLDLLVLGGFVWVKLNTDPFVIGVAVATMIVIAVAEQIFLKKSENSRQSGDEESHAHDHH